MVAAFGGAPGLQVAVDVGPPKAVDRLLGVADQQQGRVLPVLGNAVNGIEELQLQGRGVLEFIDQRHRKLRAQTLRQPLTGLRPLQGRGQALQHVGKTELRGAALEFDQSRLHSRACMQTGGQADLRQLLQTLQQCGVIGTHGRQIHRTGVGLSALAQALGRETVPTGFHRVLQLRQGAWRLRPTLQALQPFGAARRLELAAVPAGLPVGQLAQHPIEQDAGPFDPAGLQALQLRVALGLRPCHGLRQRARLGPRQILVQQGAHVGVQCCHIGPHRSDLRHLLRTQRVQLLAPVVLHRLQTQRRFVGQQAFLKQVAAVERVFAQHALAPGIDRVDRRLVHGLRGQGQAVCGLFAGLALGVVGQQGFQKILIRGQGAPEHLGRLGQPCANAVGQFARGRACEGHHQDVGGHQGAQRACALLAMAQHQPDIECSNRPGLARAGTRLDQVTAAQRKAVHMQWLRAHAASPSSPMASASHWATQASKGSYTAAAQASKRPSASKASSVG